MNEHDIEYLHIYLSVSSQRCIVEKLLVFSFGLYHIIIRLIESCCREPKV